MRLTFSTAGVVLALVQVVIAGPAPKLSQDATCGAAKGTSCQGSQWGDCCSKNGYCGAVSYSSPLLTHGMDTDCAPFFPGTD